MRGVPSARPTWKVNNVTFRRHCASVNSFWGVMRCRFHASRNMVTWMKEPAGYTSGPAADPVHAGCVMGLTRSQELGVADSSQQAVSQGVFKRWVFRSLPVELGARSCSALRFRLPSAAESFSQLYGIMAFLVASSCDFIDAFDGQTRQAFAITICSTSKRAIRQHDAALECWMASSSSNTVPGCRWAVA